MSKKQMFKVTCKICGKEFIANSNQRSLCSDKCKEENKLRIARERALKREKENNREEYRKKGRHDLRTVHSHAYDAKGA